MASGDPALPSIDAALPDVAAWLTATQAPFCLIGGVAASMLGFARTTLDIDILTIMEEERWETAWTLAGQFAEALDRNDIVQALLAIKQML